MRKYLLSLVCLVLTIWTANAQVTSSSLTGTIKDSKGLTLPGATVKAIHKPSGTVYTTATNTNGKFTIPNMRVGGPYTVEISYIGYQPNTVDNVVLKLGEPGVINGSLNDAGTQLNEVVVRAQSSRLNTGKTGAATNISTRELTTLPTITRSITDFTRLTPQANGNSFGGRDGRFNNVQIDGANFNNGFGLNSDPLPGGNSQPISLDAIEEIQVNIAPYDVRQSGFTGAGINAVTRSGTNDITGSVYGYYRNQKFNGRKVGDVELPKLNESSTRILGFRVGGPIIKDKLFLFLNAEQVENKGSNPDAVNLWQASTDGKSNPAQNIARPTVTDLEAVRNHSINTLGYDPGSYQNYANNNGDKSTNLLARIDWNISDKHKLALRYNQVVGNQPSLVNGSSGPYPRSTSANRVSERSIAFSKTMYETKNVVRSFTAELNSNINSQWSNQLLATYSRIQQTRTSPSEIFPMIDIGDGTGSVTAPESYVNYISLGYELFTFGNDVKNDNYSIIDNVTYVTGKHTFTGGLSFESQKFGNQYIRLGTSYYRYASVADFLKVGTPQEVAPINFGVTYPYAGQDPYAPVVLGTAGAYIQDRISVNDRLDLTLGLRAEMPIYMNDLTPNPSIDNLELLGPDGKPRHYTTGEWPKSSVMLSPRIGFNYDVYGDASLKLRGGTGLFTGRVPFVWLTNMPSNSGVIQNNVEGGSYDAIKGWIGDIRFNKDPYYWVNNTPTSAQGVFIKSPRDGVPSSFALVDNNFKMPKVWRTSVGADYAIPGTPLVATADVIYTYDINAPYQFGANRALPTNQMNYSGDDRDFYPTGTPYNYNTAVRNANTGIVLTNTDKKGNSFSGTLGLSLTPQKGFFGSLFYTYSSAKSISDNPGSNAASAWGGSPSINSPNDQILYNSQYATPHRIVGTLSYRLEYANHLASTFTLFYNGQNQGRFSYTYTGDINGDSFTDLIYVPRNGSELTFTDIKAQNGSVTFTAAQQLEAYNAFVNNSDYLSKNKGKYAERNGALLPWLNRFDFKFLQDVFTNIGGKRNTLQLSVDIFNVGNLLNKKWGTQKTLNGAQSLLRVASVTPQGVPTFNLNTVNGELPTTTFRDVTTATGYNTWGMQLGVRYIFN